MSLETVITSKAVDSIWKRFLNEHPTVLVMFLFCVFLGASNYVQYSSFMSLVVAEKAAEKEDKDTDFKMQEQWQTAINKSSTTSLKITELIESNNKIYIQDRIHHREYLNLQFESVNTKLDKLLDNKRWQHNSIK